MKNDKHVLGQAITSLPQVLASTAQASCRETGAGVLTEYLAEEKEEYTEGMTEEE